MRTTITLLLTACVTLLLGGSGAAATQLRGQARGRDLVAAPKDVYAVKITNQLKGAINATVTYSKGMSNELMVQKKQIAAGTSFTSGPYDYEEGTAKFHYIVQAVRVRRNLPAGEAGLGAGAVPDMPQESLQIQAPFNGVNGVTPLLEVTVEPMAAAEDATQTHLGAVTTKVPPGQ